MIGWLIEDQDVGFFEQEARQQRTRALPPAELFQRAMHVYPVDAKSAEHGANLDLVRVPASVLECLHQPAVALQRRLSLLGIGQQRLQAP